MRPTSNKVVFEFPEVTCKEILFEWADIEVGYYASACEFIILFPENKYINDLLYNVYDPNDYKCLTLNNKYKDIIAIEEIIDKIQEFYDFSKNIQKIVEKIKNIINGKLKYEPKREFTTNQNSKINVIKQFGDVRRYSREILKMEKGSTDKQPTGIFGLKNEIITIYVDSKDNNLLPSIQFSQFRSHSTSWISSAKSLKKGRNVLKFNEFDVSSFKIETISGGPIYIINEYTSSEQSQDIKIYIEGGKLFPLFRVNEDEVNFKKILSNFCFNL